MGKYTKQQIWDIIQWVLIVLLLIACVYIGKENYDLSNSLEFKMGNTYTRIYDSQKIESLKAENKALYDSIKHLKNVESIVEVRYKYYYNTDTVFVNNSDTTKKIVFIIIHQIAIQFLTTWIFQPIKYIGINWTLR